MICCGTGSAFADACFHERRIDWKMTDRGIWYFGHADMVVISFFHPAARVRDCYLYYALMDAVKDILSIREQDSSLLRASE